MKQRIAFALFTAAAAFIAACGQTSGGNKPPQEQIDVVSIRSELLQIARAEQTYLVMHSSYGSLEDLQNEKLLADAPDRRGYTFSLSINGTDGFVVTASPADQGKANWPTLTVDQTQQISEKPKAE
ncbi:MAG TPA: hypothetical protein VN628_10425 [Vicinamibacterales bacterium]|nr:hypothetical protein [Vicinamibacterales bacterium]